MSRPPAEAAAALHRLIHDQGNALAVVAGHLQLLEPRLRDRPELHAALARALRACFRAASGLDSVRLSLTPPALPAEAVDPAPLLIAWCEEVLPPLLGPEVRLRTRIPPGLPPCRVGRETLGPPLLALALLLLEDMPQGGVLRVAAAPRRAGVTVTLADSASAPDSERPGRDQAEAAALAEAAGMRLLPRPRRAGGRALALLLPPAGP